MGGNTMSSIKNPVSCPGPKIPELLAGKVQFVANFAITQREANLFSLVLEALKNQLLEDGINKRDLTRVTAIFTKDGSFEFQDVDDDQSLGLHFSLAVYSMEKIRVQASANEIIFLMVFAEELVHHYWRLEDEVETKVIVTKIVNRLIDKKVKITDLFSREGLNEELIKQGKPPRY